MAVLASSLHVMKIHHCCDRQERRWRQNCCFWLNILFQLMLCQTLVEQHKILFYVCYSCHSAWLSTPPPFILSCPPILPLEWQRPYKVMAARPHPAAPAGWAGEPRPAAWNSCAGAERTGRERAPAWPMIHQRRLEVPPQTAGSRTGLPVGPGRQGNGLRRRENKEAVCLGALLKVRFFQQGGCVRFRGCGLPGLNKSGLSQCWGSWWIDHMLTKTRVPRLTEWPPILREGEKIG